MLSRNTEQKRRAGRSGASFWLASAALSLPLLSLAGLSSLQARIPADLFAPPAAPFLLVRTLHSPLADGREIVSRRTYEVSIQPAGAGFTVQGRLLACDVEAPEALRALADIERGRVDHGLFPMMLDAQGMIVGVGDDAAPAPERERAGRLTGAMVDGASTSPQERRDAQALVRKVQSSPVITPLPADLFHPAPGRQVDRREVPMADGSVGLVTIERNASIGGEHGTLGALSRIVTTRMGTSSRVTREDWVLRFPE